MLETAESWSLALFGAKDNLTWLHYCTRAVLILAYSLVAIRLAGRRLLGKWSSMDFVVSIMIASSLGRAMTGGAELWATLAAVTLLLILHAMLAQWVARSDQADVLLSGEPVTLAENGRVNRRAMHRCGVSMSDLEEALRRETIDDLSKARRVVLETSGKISVVRED